MEGVEIYEEQSDVHCVGCRAVVSIALNRIHAAGQMGEFAGLKVLLNNIPKEELELKQGEHLFCVGNCTKEYGQTYPGDQVHFIRGCAPAGLTVEDAIREVYGVLRKNVEMTAVIYKN